jgi:hypothetical protein
MKEKEKIIKATHIINIIWKINIFYFKKYSSFIQKIKKIIDE